MEIFNIGPLELILFLLLMFIILGPQDMVEWARKAGAWLRKLIRSQIWAEIREYSQEIRELPTKLVRETGLDEDLKEIRDTTNLASDLASVNVANEAGLAPVNVINEANQDTNQIAGTLSSPSSDGSPVLTYPTSIPEPVIPIKFPSKYATDTFDFDAAPVTPFYHRDFVTREEERIKKEKEAAEAAEREAAEREAARLAELQAAEAAKKPRRKRTPKTEPGDVVPESAQVEPKPRRRTTRKKTEASETDEAQASIPFVDNSSPQDSVSLQDTPTEKPKPKRSPRRKAEPTSPEKSETVVSDQQPADTSSIASVESTLILEPQEAPAAPPPAPVRKRTPRKKQTDQEVNIPPSPDTMVSNLSSTQVSDSTPDNSSQ